jgi:hypothetical protein
MPAGSQDARTLPLWNRHSCRRFLNGKNRPAGKSDPSWKNQIQPRSAGSIIFIKCLHN